MSTIGAHVKYKFKKGFLLDEEKLRKIHDIISKRKDDNEVKYTVFREDSFSFKTNNIEDIIKEENLKWARINAIKINLDSKDKSFDSSLDFDDSGVNLSINGENRDNVFLLFSELKEYMSNEVCTQRLIPKNVPKFITMILLISVLFLFAILQYSESPKTIADVNNVMKSNDINEKINFLIQQNIKKVDFAPVLYIFPILLLFMLFDDN